MKTILVTGSNGNLGKVVVEKFLTEKYDVIGTVSGKPSSDTKTEKGVEQFAVDLTDENASADFVSAVIEKYKQIDIAVLTAGGFAMGDISSTSEPAISKQYKLNFSTAYNIARPVFMQMKKQGYGRIFLIGSRPGLSAHKGKGMVAYSLSKSLLFHLAELLNDESKGINIVTSVVIPSTIDTPQNRSAMPDADFSKWVKPEVIADIIHFYCSDETDSLREPVIKVYNNS
jgi:NAD(P)-dependent dehydrogenase (short-subunit alcohol dehydrogenase family)